MFLSWWLSTSEQDGLYRYATVLIIAKHALLLVNTPTDINECEVTKGICGADKNCINGIGNFTCQCKSGYQELPHKICQGMEY